jgi:hypothetical protein
VAKVCSSSETVRVETTAVCGGETSHVPHGQELESDVEHTVATDSGAAQHPHKGVCSASTGQATQASSTPSPHRQTRQHNGSAAQDGATAVQNARNAMKNRPVCMMRTQAAGQRRAVKGQRESHPNIYTHGAVWV